MAEDCSAPVYHTDAPWYFRERSEEEEKYYEIFLSLCRKFKIDWADAAPKERAFAEEVTRVTFEHWKARRDGLPLSTVRPFFE